MATVSNITKLGSIAVEMAPRLWERYSQDRKREILEAPYRPDPSSWGETGLHAAWLGHTTVLLRIDGLTILTDPVFGSRVGINMGPVTLGLKRIVEPALSGDEIPQPDIVLLSHAHMDHFDIPSLRSLESKNTTVVTASKTADLLRRSRYGEVHEVGWGGEVRLGDVVIRGFEVNHWGARVRTDTHRGFNGYVIQTPRYRVLFGGDTAMTDSFRTVKTAKPIDLAIMPIGAYNPWIGAHCTPEQALKMANDAGADYVLPVHHQTFQLSNEPYREPIERFVTALGGNQDRAALTAIGQEFHFQR
jgi:L-ascorbate metabolism protein UlaG (beta-lactamase superfamily)